MSKRPINTYASFIFVFCSIMVTMRPIALIAGQVEVERVPLNTAVQAFDEGTTSLLDGNFGAAIAAFEKADQSGWASAELYYNMGLAYHRLNRFGLAVQYLEKAKRIAPDDPKILHSLTVAAHRQADRFSQLPRPFWQKMHVWVENQLPIGVAFWIGIVLWFGLVALITGKLLSHWHGEWWRRARILLGVSSFLLIFYSLTTSAWPPTKERAVILSTEARMHDIADESSDEVLRVHEGLVVLVKNRSTDWALIEVANGSRGWVEANLLGTI